MTDNNSCPVCNSSDHFLFLERARVPVFQNWPLADRDAAVSVVRGDLVLHACRRCGIVFNRAFDPGLVEYGEDYDNSQQHSEVFTEYMDALVDRIVDQCDAAVATIVEVGCGKGAFLKALVSRLGPGYPQSVLIPPTRGWNSISRGGCASDRAITTGAPAAIPTW